MKPSLNLNRRDFVKTSLLASAALPLAVQGQAPAAPAPAAPPANAPEAMPKGRIAGQEFSRLMLGGNLISGWAHARELGYVATLMRRYNTDSKIRETLELAEANGINAINTYVMDDNRAIWDHWKNGGKMKWFTQVRLDGTGGYTQIQKAVDEGALGIHVNGDASEAILASGKMEKFGQMMAMVKKNNCISGVAAHDLRVIEECVKLKLEVDFYQKTLHTHDYYTSPRPDETNALGAHDNSWCKDPQAVVGFMSNVKEPWIAFKILAAGGLQPRTAFPYAFNSGADFILVGMFDWQIADNVKLARRVYSVSSGPSSPRTRPWCG
jgi:hypothetical protein